jgi:ribosomal protein S19
MDQLPEVDHAHGAHAHGTGHKWLDIVVAVSAIFISVVSLVVSIEHGRTMAKMVDQNEKMVEASTMPVLTEDSTVNIDTADPKKTQVKIIVKNSGIGPAMIDRFELIYKGKNYDSTQSSIAGLLKDCCIAALPTIHTALTSDASTVTGSVLPPRESIRVFGIAPRTPELLGELQRAQSELKFKACYCSVLNQCWETDFTNQRPKPVAECKVTPGEKLW